MVTKKIKKISRLVKGLKKLLCCCWCAAQQQDEQDGEYVVVEGPRPDEGERDGVREESDSLADSSSETAQSLPVTCGLTPACESDQSLSEECMALEEPVHEVDVQVPSEEDFMSASEGNGESPEGNTSSPEEVEEADQVALSDEAFTEKTCSLTEEPVRPSATQAPEHVEEPGKTEGHTESSAARRRRRRKKKVQHEEKDDGGEWQVVCKKPRRKKNETAVQERKTPVTKPPKPELQRVARKPKQPLRPNKSYQDDRDRVRLSWQESTVKVTVQVPPNRRRHVIGTRGDTIRQLQQQYPAVRVSVPGPQDLTSREVIIEGPKTQAEAVALQITNRLQAIEEKLREEEQRRQERKTVVIKVEVPPDMRRHVVGPRGETLRRLAQQHPAVRVTVPAPSDTRNASVSIKGPRNEASAVEKCIRECLHAAGQRQRQRQPKMRKQ